MAPTNEKTSYVVNGHDPAAASANEGNFTVPAYPPATGKWFSIKKLLHRWWVVEAFSSLFALAIFTCIIGLLVNVDGEVYGSASDVSANAKDRPDIFTYLSFLSALMRAAMLLPVATSIGQWKWSWFRSSRQLIDLERFDSAASSIFGSAKLLLALKFRSVACIGAALTILALPMDALIQSSVRMPSKLDVNDYPYYANETDFPFNVTGTTIQPRNTFYKEWQTMEDKNKPWPATTLINAIQFAQTYNNGLSQVINADTRINCPTNYCVFTEIQTLAIGAVCEDRTSAMTIIPARLNESAYQTLPGTDLQFFFNGSNANGYARQIIAAKSYTGWPDDEYNTSVYGPGLGIPGPLITRTAMIMSTYNDTLAAECALYWHVSTEANFINNATKFKMLLKPKQVNYAFAPGNNNTKGRESLWDLKPEKCIVDGKEISHSDDDFYKMNCVFSVERQAGYALQNYLLDDLDGFVGDSWLKSINSTTNDEEWTRTNTFITNLYEIASLDGYSLGEIFQRLLLNWENIGFMTSYTIRQANSISVDGRTEEALNGTGKIYHTVYYYSIEWPRLIMPAIILLSAAGFVLCTAILTWHEYSWRKSSLPLLFHGLEGRERAAIGDVRDHVSMQHVAENIQVRLNEHVDDQGARFTTQHR